MKFEDSIKNNKAWAEHNQKEFDSLSEDEKVQKKELDHEKALEMKDRVELYVSPEDIVPGINTKGLAKMNDIFRNKPIENVGKATKGEIGQDFETSFADSVISALSNDLEKNQGQKFNKIRNLFKGKPIIDLGAGLSICGKKIAQMLEASGYVAVEPHNYIPLEYSMTIGQEWEKDDDFFGKGFKIPKEIPYAIVPEDALTFLKRLPDHSVGIMSIGTDGYVFSEKNESQKYEEIEEYIKDCEKEIARVLHPESCFLERSSIFGRDNDYLSESEEESMPDMYDRVYIYKAVKKDENS